MKPKDPTDFWYAVNNTEIVQMPSRRLETFGATLLNYHMISELMDSVDQVRVRQGRIKAFQPQILTPTMLGHALLEGFGQAAEDYGEWLRKNASDLHVLRYGFSIRKEPVSEQVVTANLQHVLDQVKQDVHRRDDPLDAIVVGVDEPWEVCLLKLMVDVIRGSAPGNIRDLHRSRMFDEDGGVPRAVRVELDEDFRAASRDRSRIQALGAKLHQYGLFEEYQDRFFSLVKGAGI